ncbi:MAG: hypothetical protein JWR07_1909 [Nevskia sp.]|nr:hypothetical protein [Nevskia sp.]
MADTKISALTAASALTGVEVLPVVQSAATVGATVTQLVTRVTAAGAGGSTTQVQFNAAGAFGADAGLTFDTGTQKTLTVGGNVATSKSTTTTYFGAAYYNGTNMTALTDSPSMIRFSTQTLDLYAGPGGTTAGATYALSASPQISLSNGIGVVVNGFLSIQTAGVGIGSSAVFKYSSTTNGYGAADLGTSRNAAGILEVNNGAAGTFRDLKLRNLLVQAGVVTLANFTAATLPSASTSGNGSLAAVTDATAVTARTIVAGGGANKVTVQSDGTNWLITA